MASISDKVILVTLELKGTTGSKVDKNISKEVADSKSAVQKELGNFTKKLFGKFPELEIINKYDAAQRKNLERMTLPFARSQHLLPSDKLMEYYSFIKDVKTNRAKLVKNMVDAIPGRIEAIKQSQADGFDESMIPTPEEMGAKFYVEHFESILPEKSNFEKLLGVDELLSELQEEFDSKMEGKLGQIEDYLKNLLKERLETLRERLYKHDKDSRKIQQRMIDGTIETAQRVKDLNVTAIESINEQCNDVVTLLSGLSSDIISNVDSIRQETIQSLDSVISKLN